MYQKLLPLFLLLFSLSFNHSQAQVSFTTDHSFKWNQSDGYYQLINSDRSNASYASESYIVTLDAEYASSIISSTEYKVINKSQISSDYIPKLRPKITQEFKDGELRIKIYPFYVNKNDEIVLLSDLSIRIWQEEQQTSNETITAIRSSKESQFAAGEFYKIAIKESGPVKLTQDFFIKNNIPLNKVNPQHIQIWGHDSGMLPLKNSHERIDDIKQLAIYQKGLSDGSFDASDYIIFYGVGPVEETRNDGFVKSKNNPFSAYNYYFIKLGDNKAKAIHHIEEKPSNNSSKTDKINILIAHEVDQVNLLERQPGNSGSGLNWYGELINGGKSLEFSHLLNRYSSYNNGKLRFETSFAGRHNTTTLYKNIVNDLNFQQYVGSTKLHDESLSYANAANLSGTVTTRDRNEFIISYEAPSSASGWLDHININLDAYLSSKGLPYCFTINELEGNIALGTRDDQLNKSSSHVWDITDAFAAKRIQPVKNGSNFDFALEAVKQNNKFLVFDEKESGVNVTYINKVAPQDLHGITHADMLIITHPEFMEASERLAEFRRGYNDYIVEVINTEEIYNEFGSGRKSPIAIRDFIKMVYDRAPLKHVLLMGDASFDYRHILSKYPDHNFVPTIHTDNSLYYFSSFSYDDFFALLDDEDGGNLYGKLKIGIGRIPAKNIKEANNVVDKIIHYETSEEAFGDWRLRSVFVADDDNKVFMKSSSEMADSLQEAIPPFNPIKILLDAFIQESFADGDRYPEANKALNNSIHSGALIVNYVGHGGPSGWAQERVLTMQDINQWNNFEKLPLFITATCTFSAYDNPGFTSGGEQLLLKQNGGGIALFSTTRPVYDSQNRELTGKAFEIIYETTGNGTRQLGEILRRAKNQLGSGFMVNSRKFILLGDPALELAVPRFHVKATKINSIETTEFTDTLRALETITIEGKVVNDEGNTLSGFNGVLTALLYDKAVTKETLGQESPSQVFKFKQQENILFRGQFSVKNGKFKFDFTLPKDIDYAVGNGKLSFYAYSSENLMDAMGVEDSILIGGISEDIIVDNEPPHIDLYLDDISFTNGDYTNSNPLLLAYLSDKETGINAAGQSIGHDIIAYLDNDITSSVVLNNFYTAELDNPKAGTLSYLLSDISPGPHTLTLEAWDLSNNKGTATINFHVTENNEIMVMETKASPNPFSSSTQLSIKHNLGGKNLKLTIPIYDASGQHIMTLTEEYENAPSTIQDIIIDSKSFPTMQSNMYFYRIILEHRLFTGEIIRIADNDNKLIYVR